MTTFGNPPTPFAKGGATPAIFPTAEPAVQLPAEDQGWIDRFKARIAEFTEVFNRLKGMRGQVEASGQAEINAEYESLITEGDRIQTSIDSVTGGINTAVNWFKATFGLDGIGMANKGQLGAAIPLLPVAAISGVMAYIGSWIAKVYMFNEKWKRFDDLVAGGVLPDEAAKVVADISKQPTVFGMDFGKLVVPLLIVGGIFWFMRDRRL